MRNEAEMTALILQVGQEIGVQAIAISGSRQNPQVKRDRFQDYDIVYIVDNLPELLAEPSWLKKQVNYFQSPLTAYWPFFISLIIT